MMIPAVVSAVLMLGPAALSEEEKRLAKVFNLPVIYASRDKLQKRMAYTFGASKEVVNDGGSVYTVLGTYLPTGRPYYSIEVYVNRAGEKRFEMCGLVISTEYNGMKVVRNTKGLAVQAKYKDTKNKWVTVKELSR